MPIVTVDGEKTFEVAAGTKLVLAIEDRGREKGEQTQKKL